MSYIIANNIGKRKIIVSNQKLDGNIIYEGHKLGLPNDLLPYIIYHTHERYNSSFYFLDYKKWKDIYNMEEINTRMTNCWIKDTDGKRALMKSYNTILESLKDIDGNFSKIYIVEN